MLRISQSIVFILLLFGNQLLAQELRLPRLFSDHMIIQRDMPARIWGWASPGQEVRITIDQVAVTAMTDEKGRWECLYPAHQAGGPYLMSVEGAQTLEVNDLWFGDVWIAGGQSNMGWKLKSDVDDWEAEVMDSDYPEIRFFKVANDVAFAPKEELQSGDWKIANPENSPEFSAVAWFFAKHNHIDKNIPVGVIESNWGGTPAEAWTSAPMMLSIDEFKAAAEEVMDPGIDWSSRLRENEQRNVRKGEIVNNKDLASLGGVHLPAYDDKSWKSISLPTDEQMSDVVWLRKKVMIDGQPKKMKITAGNLSYHHRVFINGKELEVPPIIPFEIPKGILKKGENTIALRLINTWNNQVFIRPGEDMWLDNGDLKVSLEGEWKYSNEVEPPIPETTFFEHKPAVLYNAMISPIQGYSIKGAIWYQGESNAGQWQLYHELFEKMILDWRIQWRQGVFPFLFVQLANFMERMEMPSDTDWARLREAQTEALALPNTGMAVAIDIGNAKDIHPRNKQDVGARLWLSAKKVAYGDEVVYSGPVYKSHRIEGSKVMVSFDHLGTGLLSKGQQVVGFSLAGSDRKFYWANGEVEGDEVVLNSPEVDEPLYIRYAWADNPACNLYNREGFPAVPFRTDDFDQE